MIEALHEQQPLRAEAPVTFTPYPYDQLDAETVKQIGDDAVQRADVLIEGIVTHEQPSFETVIAPFDEVADVLIQAKGRGGFMELVHTDEATRDAGDRVEVQLNKFAANMWFDKDLYRVAEAFANTPAAQMLSGEDARLLALVRRNFRYAGNDLESAKQDRLKEIQGKLIDLESDYHRNLSEASSEDTTWVAATDSELADLPESFVTGLTLNEDGKRKVTMAYGCVRMVMQQASSRDLRRRVYQAFDSRATESNRPVLEQMSSLRQEAAYLYAGHDQPSWAAHQLESRIVKTPEQVRSFYDRLVGSVAVKGSLAEQAQRDIETMAELLAADGQEGPVQLYDWEYYKTQLSQTKYSVDPKEVAEYFSLPTIVEGIQSEVGEILDIDYRELKIPTWHPDVKAYSIDDAQTGEQRAIVYMDMLYRKGKHSHPCAQDLVPGRRLPDGTYRPAEIAIISNFNQPTAETPTLPLETDRVTLWHESGHIHHYGLSRTKYVEFAGFNTEPDFMEAISQMFERIANDPEVLKRTGKHYKTGEPIPAQLAENISAAGQIFKAIDTLRQVFLGKFDLALHDESKPKDMDRTLREASAVMPFPFLEGTFKPSSFGHLSSETYAGSYSGYQLSKIYAGPFWEQIKPPGGNISPNEGRRFRETVLERGGSVDGAQMIIDFLGQSVGEQVLLKTIGPPQVAA